MPGLDVAVTRVSQTTPVYITKSYWFASNQGSPGTNFIQCVDFRVLSRKPVADVRFTIHFRDTFDNEHFLGSRPNTPFTLDRAGNFSPGQVVLANRDATKTYINDGSESCWVVPATFADTGQRNVTKMSIETTQVAFTDGSVWNKGQSFDQAFLPNGNTFRTPINVSQRLVTDGHAPVELISAGTGYDWGGDPQQCVAFRDVTNQVATTVDFDVFYLDGSNNQVVSRRFSHVGTFTPPVLIQDKCRNVDLGNAAQVGRLRFAEVHVRRVVFNDGTQWNEGDAFTRVYGNNGDKLAFPLLVAAANAPFVLPTAMPNVLPDVQVFGPNDNGGTPITSGQHYGAIAVDKTGSFASLAADRESPAAAAADAIEKCNAQSGGNSCAVRLTFLHCAAIAVRTLQGVGVGFFSKTDPSTKRAAEIEALTNAGATDASILASGCNT
ncbi:MAG TPA: DUF4189 domain-containing protein [Candidatus Elarobacter sp.]|nr:DUF4189 domain-containing protein [Candidatus Elarobacter sp.]